jgi:hypothetical protein
MAEERQTSDGGAAFEESFGIGSSESPQPINHRRFTVILLVKDDVD